MSSSHVVIIHSLKSTRSKFPAIAYKKEIVLTSVIRCSLETLHYVEGMPEGETKIRQAGCGEGT